MGWFDEDDEEEEEEETKQLTNIHAQENDDHDDEDPLDAYMKSLEHTSTTTKHGDTERLDIEMDIGHGDRPVGSNTIWTNRRGFLRSQYERFRPLRTQLS